MLELDASVGGRELPISLGVVFVAINLPSRYFLRERFFVADATVKTLR